VEKAVKVLGVALLCAGLFLTVGLVRGSASAGSQETKQDKQDKKDKTKPSPEQTKAPDQKAPAQDNTVTVSGKVATVGDAKVTIVDDQKSELTVALTPDTKITKGGKEITVAEVKADDMVTILAKKGDDNSLWAVRIVVT
jgi:hypothetical protein